MAMDMQLDHAEKLVENIRVFIREIEKKRIDPIDLALLDGLNSILVAMSFEAVDYLNALKGDFVVENPLLTADLKESLMMLDVIFNNGSTDTMFSLFPYYITVHSGVKALDW